MNTSLLDIPRTLSKHVISFDLSQASFINQGEDGLENGMNNYFAKQQTREMGIKLHNTLIKLNVLYDILLRFLLDAHKQRVSESSSFRARAQHRYTHYSPLANRNLANPKIKTSTEKQLVCSPPSLPVMMEQQK